MSDNERNPSTSDHVGQAAGGITGVLAGAAIGSTAGPIGTLLGGVAGAIGGWWSGRAIAEAAEDISATEEQHYREHFERSPDSRSRFDDVKGAYYLGDVAAANPEYETFEQVEYELSRGWRVVTNSEWEAVRNYASVGFHRGRERRSKPR